MVTNHPWCGVNEKANPTTRACFGSGRSVLTEKAREDCLPRVLTNSDRAVAVVTTRYSWGTSVMVLGLALVGGFCSAGAGGRFASVTGSRRFRPTLSSP